MLTGFQPVPNAEETAKKSFGLSNGTSPFQQDVEFTVTGWDIQYPMNDGKVDKNARPIPVLTTTVGNAFISMIIKTKLSTDGKPVEPSGTFNKKVKEIIVSSKGKSDFEILNAICDAVKDKKVRVSREFYSARSKDSREYAAYLVNLDFVD